MPRSLWWLYKRALLFKEPLFLHTCNSHSLGIIKTRCISKAFSNLRCVIRLVREEKWITLSSTHLQLQTKLNFQKTSVITCNYWKSNNCRNVSCSKCWNVTCQNTLATETGKQLQNLNPLGLHQVLLKKLVYALPDNNDFCCNYGTKYDKGVKNDAVYFGFHWQLAPHFKNTVGPTPALHKQLRYKV